MLSNNGLKHIIRNKFYLFVSLYIFFISVNSQSLNYTNKGNIIHPLSYNLNNVIFSEIRSGIVIGKEKGQIFRYDGNKLVRKIENLDISNSLAVYKDNKENLWFFKNEGIYRINNNSKRFYSGKEVYNFRDKNNFRIHSILDRNDTLYFSISYLDSNSSKIRSDLVIFANENFSKFFLEYISFDNFNYQSQLSFTKNYIWVFGNNLFRFDIKKFQKIEVTNLLNSKQDVGLVGSKNNFLIINSSSDNNYNNFIIGEKESSLKNLFYNDASGYQYKVEYEKVSNKLIRIPLFIREGKFKSLKSDFIYLLQHPLPKIDFLNEKENSWQPYFETFENWNEIREMILTNTKSDKSLIRNCKIQYKESINYIILTIWHLSSDLEKVISESVLLSVTESGKQLEMIERLKNYSISVISNGLYYAKNLYDENSNFFILENDHKVLKFGLNNSITNNYKLEYDSNANVWIIHSIKSDFVESSFPSLSKFDGYSLRNIFLNENQEYVKITAFLEDNNQNIWLCSEDGIYKKYDDDFIPILNYKNSFNKNELTNRIIARKNGQILSYNSNYNPNINLNLPICLIISNNQVDSLRFPKIEYNNSYIYSFLIFENYDEDLFLVVKEIDVFNLSSAINQVAYTLKNSKWEILREELNSINDKGNWNYISSDSKRDLFLINGEIISFSSYGSNNISDKLPFEINSYLIESYRENKNSSFEALTLHDVTFIYFWKIGTLIRINEEKISSLKINKDMKPSFGNFIFNDDSKVALKIKDKIFFINEIDFYPVDLKNTNGAIPQIMGEKIIYFGNEIIIDNIEKLDVEITNIFSDSLDLDIKPKIELYYPNNDISFNYTTFSLTYPSNTLFSTKLEGHDLNWSEYTSNKSVSFTNLTPGSYTFKVQALSPIGYHTSIKEIKFIINPPWFYSTWFLALLSLCIIAILTMGYRRRVEHIKIKQLREFESKRIKKEVQEAREMQENLLPYELPNSEKFELFAICKPAFEVGGDFFDIFWIDKKNEILAIANADVSGKAMRAAFIVSLTSGMLTLLRETEYSNPSKILDRINHASYSKKADKRMFVALSLTFIDLKNGEVKLSNSGQPEPILYRNGEVQFLKTEDPRLPLGMIDEINYKDSIYHLKKDDLLIFYSDALVETPNVIGEQFDYKRINKVIKEKKDWTAKNLGNRLKSEIESFQGNANQFDDLTIIIFKFNSSTFY